MFGLAITSCGLEEPYGGLKNNEGVIEFVARPVGFNDQVVDTKATVAEGDLETKIYSCYFLVFDTTTGTGNGKLIHCSDNLVTGTTPITSIPSQRLNIFKNSKDVKTVKACFIVNVPKNFIYNASDAPIINTLTALDDAVLGPEHFIYADGPIGAPKMTINGVSDVKCIPAFGMTPTDINLESSSAAPVPITIKRLFAKVSVDLSMDITFSNTIDQSVNTYTFFQLNNYEIRNLPKKVRLCEKVGEQCAWYNESDNFNVPIGSGTLTQNNRIYNKTSSQTPKSIKFEFYAPEYYLNSVDNPNNNQTHKPENKPEDAYAIYAFLTGVYSQYALNTKNIQYSIYLGGDAVSDFSLARNTHYTNTLVICGTDNHDSDNDNLDLRVDTDIINNPVSLHNKSANCYVINRAQKYEFPAYKGAYNDLNNAVVCTGGNAVRVIANEAQLQNDWIDITNINIEDLSYNPETNMVSFVVKKPLNFDMVPNGNIVIALVNDDGDEDMTDDEIIWSWHFWFMSDYGDLDAAGWAKIKDVQVGGTTYVMDRNLGAMTTSDNGCYYIYGTKEPYFAGGFQGDEPESGLWYVLGEGGNEVTGAKAVNDPCPPGYRVPGQIFAANSLNTSSSSSSYKYSSNISFPYSRSRSLSGNLADKTETSGTYSDHTGYSNSSTDNDQLSGDVVDITESTDGKTQYGYKLTKVQKTFTNYKYSVKSTTDFGYLWSNDNSAYKYNFNAIDWTQFLTVFRVVSADVKVVTTRQPVKRTKRSVFGQTYWGTWTNDGSSSTVTTNTTATSDFPTGTQATLMYRINDNSDGAPVGNGSAEYTNQTSSIAAPIRCLKE